MWSVIYWEEGMASAWGKTENTSFESFILISSNSPGSQLAPKVTKKNVMIKGEIVFSTVKKHLKWRHMLPRHCSRDSYIVHSAFTISLPVRYTHGTQGYLFKMSMGTCHPSDYNPLLLEQDQNLPHGLCVLKHLSSTPNPLSPWLSGLWPTFSSLTILCSSHPQDFFEWHYSS